MIAVAAVDGQEMVRVLVRFLGDRMAHFMVPRYVRTLSELPKTPSSKVMTRSAQRGHYCDPGIVRPWDSISSARHYRLTGPELLAVEEQ